MMTTTPNQESSRPSLPEITRITHPLATIWIAHERKAGCSYYYGGTRLVDPSTTEDEAVEAIVRLMRSESGIKNCLIDSVLREGGLAALEPRLPPGFLESRVGGGRCLIRPHTPEIALALSDAARAENDTATAVLRRVGEALNELEVIKLTPDFGRNARFADVLLEYTPNVLGVACERGGCGGKSSYSVTGVLAGMNSAAPELAKQGPLTCIGAAGALGSGVLDSFLASEVSDIGASDLVYDEPGGPSPAGRSKHLPSRNGSFTEECLARGGVIVATTVGDELEASPWQIIPKGTALILGHNLALPNGQAGISLARELDAQGVLVIPGQVLTLGGALTARLEWFWRKLPKRPAFDKGLAHEVVSLLVTRLTESMLARARAESTTPHEAMLRIAAEDSQ